MRRTSQAHHEPVISNEAVTSVVEADRMNHIPYEIELDTLRQSISRAPNPPGERGPEFSLLPADSGKDAWLLLAATFIVEAVVWGIPFTFGVFQEYYSSLLEFESERTSIAIVGTVTLGGLYLGSPFTLLSLRQWPQHRRKSAAIGSVIITMSLVLASFATKVWQLILTQGVLYAIGGSMLYYPLLLFVDEWFVRRKGLAYGIAWGGTGFSGLTFPFFISWSLQRYSFRTTLRILAILFVSVTTPALFFAKPRLPVSTVAARGFPNIRFAFQRPFLPCQIGSLLESLGFFMPGIFLPTYARYLGYSNTIATVSVVLLNTGNFMGCIITGFLVDRWHVTNVILLITTGATFSVFFLWGFSGSAAVICIFAFIYGAFAGSFTSTWPGVVQETKRHNHQVETGLAYAVLVASRGVGSVVSGPLSNALLSVGSISDRFSYGYGSSYGLLIAFAGLSNAMGAAAYVSRRLGWW